jgi:hypothetical protein
MELETSVLAVVLVDILVSVLDDVLLSTVDELKELAIVVLLSEHSLSL